MVGILKMISNPSFTQTTMRTRLSFLSCQITDIVALTLAALAHGLLFLLLFLGLQWHTAPTYSGVEAEIWTELPSQQTHLGVVAPAVVPAVPPAVQDADIVMAAQRQQLKKQRQEEEQRQERERQRQRQQKQRQAEVLEKQKKGREKIAQEQVLQEKKTKEQHHAEKNKARENVLQQASSALQKQQIEQARAVQLARLRAVAGEGSGGTQGAASGNGAAGLAAYADKVRARVRPNIIFNTDVLNGNPAAVVAVELAPDGALMSKQVVRSSGYADWDAAVLAALERSTPLPRGADGKVPARFTITFKPRD